MKKIFYILPILFGILFTSFSIQESFGLSTTYMGELIHEHTKGIDNRHLAKKAVLNELEKRIELFDEGHVAKIKQELDKMTSGNDFVSIEAPEYQVTAIYNYYALKGEYTMYAIGAGSDLFSPLRQVEERNPKYGISCYTGLIPVLKNSDGSPACVKSETAEKLTERGWTTVLLDDKKLETIIPTIENCQYSNTIIVIAITEAKVLSEIHSLILGEISVDDPFPDIDLHAYTEDGLHVGMDYLTKEYENQIPNAASSGDLMNGREWISLPSEINARFVVDSTDNLNFFSTNPSASMMSDGVEDFSLVGIFSDENCKRHNSPGFVQQIDSGEQLSYDYTVVENTDGTFSITFEKDEQFS